MPVLLLHHLFFRSVEALEWLVADARCSLSSRFKDCPVIAVAVKPGGPDAPDTEEPQGVPELMEVR